VSSCFGSCAGMVTVLCYFGSCVEVFTVLCCFGSLLKWSDLSCSFGSCAEVVTDGGTEFAGEFDEWLKFSMMHSTLVTSHT